MAAPLGIEPSSKALEAFVLTDELWSYNLQIRVPADDTVI